LGAYNAVTPWKRERYARQILQSFKYWFFSIIKTA
jgi:hypothetical protein